MRSDFGTSILHKNPNEVGKTFANFQYLHLYLESRYIRSLKKMGRDVDRVPMPSCRLMDNTGLQYL
ncbi:hypothetical protein SERLA73DRAFT_139056, partial [Serpula lacrymans var. lacrymans S7.3]